MSAQQRLKSRQYTNKQAATEGGCSKDLDEHLMGGNTGFADVNGF